MAWSFQQGWLHELFLKDGITFATWGLVIVTLLLVLVTAMTVWDGWRRGKQEQKRSKKEDEQRENDRKELRSRWEREDAQREMAFEPRYTLGIDLDEEGPYFWIANMGTTAFLVKTIFLNRNQFGKSIKVSLPTKWHEPVPVGSKKIFRLEEAYFPRISDIQSSAIYECETSCSLIKANGIQMISTKHSFVMYTEKDGMHIKSETPDY